MIASNAAPPAPVGQPHPDGPDPWLDEVRAQREAWEAERAAARAIHEQRRRINHPRGAARQEAWEEDVRRRRAERQERIERDRELFRDLGPGPLPIPMPVDPRSPEEQAERARPGGPAVTPPGWNNLWYFRGF
ncbi:hypothetical protein [Thiocystis violacea]|uniref:hypothetical protein n=1 Tax=Thiocystis violacea TaxID=13725 RepID=UPI0019041665|nr:hypothetical protein [Thiocystis violacea]MBK1719814.1 hypothetical protein [Thiocystis violacea]